MTLWTSIGRVHDILTLWCFHDRDIGQVQAAVKPASTQCCAALEEEAGVALTSRGLDRDQLRHFQVQAEDAPGVPTSTCLKLEKIVFGKAPFNNRFLRSNPLSCDMQTLLQFVLFPNGEGRKA